ncbi:catalase-related domain-containing protein [Variovorax sp. HJSM1_2]|uniref:catalase-related domain-containing protein n=1 Tax=Variovorax sp. HJSM1_2 TaxID=3366263 RepID=UPI003BC987E8
MDADDYSQVAALFNLMNSEERQRLFDDTARAMHGTSPEVQSRHVENCCRIDPIYGAGVAMALGLI